jgi:hypothetical protein
MKTVTRLIGLFIATVCFSSFTNAQVTRSTPGAVVPRLVNFSGKSADQQGKPITGVVGVTFAIYKDQDGGSALWLESQNVQADAKGNYAAQLGATKPDGLPLDLFTSGEARWLGVTVNGGQEQPRILLLSVPYALKAADAETLGGLPPSAFVLAAPPITTNASANSISSTSSSSAPPPNSAITGLGSASFLPLWDTTRDIVSSALFQSGSGSSVKVGIATTAPASTLDVQGSTTVRGNLSLPATGTATSTAGKHSQTVTLTASSFNSGTNAAVAENFRWQAEPSGNNTTNPSGTLNLLFGTGSSNPAETGLKIGSTGLITFANGQVFPGTGTISGVTAGTDLLGGGTSGTVTLSVDTSKVVTAVKAGTDLTGGGTGGVQTLNLDTTKVPQLATSNNFLGNQNVTGNVGVMGNVGVGTTTPGATLDVFSATAGIHAGIAKFGSNSTTDSNSILTYNGSGTTEVFQSGCPNCFMLGAQPGDGGMRVTSGKKIFFGDSAGQSRLALDSAGNASQPRTAGGTVKAMIFYDGFFDTMARCFNSTLSGAAATTPPCGFSKDKTGPGDYVFDFGFQVDDRFYSLTNAPFFGVNGLPDQVTACSDLLGCIHTLTPNQVEVETYKDDTFADAKFWLIVY